jgi:hypothetical protein
MRATLPGTSCSRRLNACLRTALPLSCLMLFEVSIAERSSEKASEERLQFPEAQPFSTMDIERELNPHPVVRCTSEEEQALFRPDSL